MRTPIAVALAVAAVVVAATLASALSLKPQHAGAADAASAHKAARARRGDAKPRAPPTTLFPPPKFHGYIVLDQFVCESLLCPTWDLSLTRLAVECFTWDCQHEEKQLATIVPTAPIKFMSFRTLGAYHHKRRLYYTAAITDVPAASAILYTAHVNGTFRGATVISQATFLFPNVTSTLSSLEVTANNTVIAIFRHGAVATVDPKTGNVVVVGTLLDGEHGWTHHIGQATTVDQESNTLYAFANNHAGTDPRWITMDLRTFAVRRNVKQGALPYIDYAPSAFEVLWVPEINNLVMFSTSPIFDNIIYVDPRTGNASYAFFDLMNAGNYLFRDDSGTKHMDTNKNAVYDRASKRIYFQATQVQDDDFLTTLVVTPPFAAGAPQPLEWLNTALQPVDFGYANMVWTSCDGPCPT